MGFCSYCYQHAGSSYGLSDECFSWDAARGCSGLTGPDDPVRVARVRAYEAQKAKDLRDKAKKLRADADKEAKRLEQLATTYE